MDESNEIRRRETPFLAQAIRASWVVLIFCAFFQMVFFGEIVNIYAVVAVAIDWLITTKFVLTKKMLENYLFSTFMILGLSASQFYMPLLFTTLENKPLIYNLELPEEVFFHSAAAAVVMVAAHSIYRFLMKVTPNRRFSILENAGFFTPPTHTQFWIMGALGMFSSFYVYFTNPEVGQEVTGAPGDKLIQALVPFIYAPFFIPLGRLVGNNQKIPKGFTLVIVGYAILLFGISMARNSRGAFMFALTTPAFAYIIGLFLGVFKTRLFSFKNFAIAGFVIWLLVGPFTDLGTAMLIVRGNAKDIPPGELLMMTLETMQDKKALEARAEEGKAELLDFDWDERYLDNLFTSRFSNIKFNDSNLITYSKVGPYDPDMQAYSLDVLLAGLPDPVITKLGFEVDKETVLEISFGDYLYILSGGYGTQGGLRQGQMAGTGMATFGWWYLAVLGLIVIPIF